MVFRYWCGKDWGFKLGEVKQQVIMRYARFDPGIPLAAVELSAVMLPIALLKLEETDIHFSHKTLDAFFESEITPKLSARM